MQYARYNVWANKRLTGVMLQLPAEALEKPMNSSFPTLYDTALHIYSAEFIWLQRLQLVEKPEWVQGNFQEDFETLTQRWLEASQALVLFTEKQFNDAVFDHVVQYYNLQKQSFKTTVSGILHHVFNHSSQHRGQLITMLRQAGVAKIPALDLIVFLREKK